MRPPRSMVLVSLLSIVLPTVGTAPDGTPSAAAQTEATGAGLVAFASARDGDFEVYAMRPDGTGQHNLSQSPASEDLDPAWSPDGSRIAFARFMPGDPTADLFLMNADGWGKVRLTSDQGMSHDREPAWRADGRLLAFTRSIPTRGTSRIFVVRPDGSRLRAITDAPAGRYDASPDWSPTGDRIVFASDRSGGFPEIWGMNVGRIDSVRLTWNKPVRLTRNSKVDGNPAWSPDGTRIAFERCCPGGSSEIFVMNADGTGSTRLTFTPENETDPAWSPDGSRLIYTVYPEGGGNRDISILDGEGSSVLTDTAPADVSPDWGAGTAEPLDGGPAAEKAAETAAGTAAGPVPGSSALPAATTVLAAGGRSAAATSASAGTVRRYRVRSERVVRGVRLLRIRDRKGPNRIFVLKVNPQERPTMDAALAQGQLPGRARTSAMARAHRALAAINGDFGLPTGRPAHPFAEDGDLKQTSMAFGFNFAMAQDEGAVHLRHPAQWITALQTASGDRLRIDRWNDGEPTWGEVVAFSPAGGALEVPPGHACAVRLLPQGGRRWAGSSVARDFAVDLVRCSWKRMAPGGGVVLAAQPSSPGATLIRSLRRGERVRVSWSLGWPRVADAVGGFPLLVRDGLVSVTDCTASLCYRHPRTGIGVTADGRLLLVVVDGRRRGSVGMTLVGFARLFRWLGARDALNLDGGGSSTMVVRGKVVNRPSDGAERWVCSAILVLRGGDAGERVALSTEGLPAPGSTLAPDRRTPVSGPGPGREAVRDPGSTGGLADALDRGVFGGRDQLSPELRDALRAFRA